MDLNLSDSSDDELLKPVTRPLALKKQRDDEEDEDGVMMVIDRGTVRRAEVPATPADEEEEEDQKEPRQADEKKLKRAEEDDQVDDDADDEEEVEKEGFDEDEEEEEEDEDDEMADFIVDDDEDEEEDEDESDEEEEFEGKKKNLRRSTRNKKDGKKQKKRDAKQRKLSFKRKISAAMEIVDVAELDEEDEEEAREKEVNRESMARLLQTMEEAKADKVVNLTTVPDALCASLYRHQHQALTWLYLSELKIQCGMLCDDQGLGKTIEMIALLLKNPPSLWVKKKYWDKQWFPEGCPQQTLCILPVSLMKQWKAELAKFAPMLKVGVYHTEGDGFEHVLNHIDEYDVILTTYSIMRLEGDPPDYEPLDDGKKKRPNFNREDQLLERFKCFAGTSTKYQLNDLGSLFRRKWYRLVLDESHIIKNSKTSTYRAACRLVSVHRWCLTGTPIHNNLEELYSQLSFLYGVEQAKSRSEWSRLIASPIQALVRENAKKRKNIPNSTVLKEQKAWKILAGIVDRCILRRTKFTPDPRGDLFLVPLPYKQTVVRKIWMTPLERENYGRLHSATAATFEFSVDQHLKESEVFKNIFVWILRLRQFCDHPLLLCHGLESDSTVTAARKAEDRDDADSEADNIDSDGEYKYQMEYRKSPVVPKRKRAKLENPVKSESSTVKKKVKSENVKIEVKPEVGIKIKPENAVPAQQPHGNINGGRQEDELFGFAPDAPLLKEFKQEMGQGGMDPRGFWSSSKMTALFEDLLRARRESGPRFKALIFSQFTMFLNLVEAGIQQLGFGTVRLDGTLNQEERQNVIHQFRSCPNVNIFMASLQAGGVGLNLVEASHVFILDPWWSCALEDQAIDRCHRIGQLAPVRIVRYITEGSIEMEMLRMQEKKRKLSAGAFGEKIQEAKTLSLKDLYNMFGAGKTKKKIRRHMKEEELKAELQKVQRGLLDAIRLSLEEQLVETIETKSLCGAGESIGFSQAKSPLPLAALCAQRVRTFANPSFVLQELKERCDTNMELFMRNLRSIYDTKFADNKLGQAGLLGRTPGLILDGSANGAITEAHLVEFPRLNGGDLVSLTLERCVELKPEMVTELGNLCPKLKEVRLIRCGHCLDTDTVKAFLSGCYDLQKIELNSAYKLTSLQPLLEKQGLVELSVPHCFEGKIPDDEVSQLNWVALETLEVLDLSYCTNLFGQRRNHALEVGGANASSHIMTLANLIKEVKRIRVLKIAGFDEHQCSKSFVKSIADNLYYLQELDLGQCANMLYFQGFFTSLFPKCKDTLERLNLGGIVVETVEAIKEHEKEKEHLMETQTIATMARESTEEVEKANLEMVDAVNRTRDKTQLQEADSDHRRTTFFNSKDAIKVNKNRFLTNEQETLLQQNFENDRRRLAAREMLKELGWLENLRFLDLSLLDVMDDDLLLNVTEHCQKLEFLSLNGCSALSSKSFKSIERLQRLRTLDVSWCTGLETNDVCLLVEHLPALRLVCLHGCPEIFPKKLKAIYEKVKDRNPELIIRL